MQSIPTHILQLNDIIYIMQDELKKAVTSTKKYWHNLGPGLVTGASDDDPSGIATYSQTGAQYGFKFLWTSLLTFPLMAIVQEMCARIALVTGRGLASNIKNFYPKYVLYVFAGLLFFVNTVNIGADLGAMAKAAQLLAPKLPFIPLLILFGIGGLLLEIFLSYRIYAKYLKWLALILLTYVASLFFINFDWSEIARNTFIPHFSFTWSDVYIFTAILGTTISPYLFFWQTSQEIEEKELESISSGITSTLPTKSELKTMRVDVWSGMFFSNLVMFAIIAVCGATLYKHGITNITSAEDAALALYPIAGKQAFVLFALGIIGTGLLAIPILSASASYALSECFSWKEGLNEKFKNAKAFYVIIILSIIFGLLFNFLHINPIKALIYTAVLNGLIAPLILFAILEISGSRKVMGEYKNSKTSSIFGWFVAILMTLSSIATIVSFLIK